MDKKNSFGILYLTNGEKFAGNFKEDQAYGYGTYHRSDNEMISGYWENNIFIREN